jgi:hypothetical protein
VALHHSAVEEGHDSESASEHKESGLREVDEDRQQCAACAECRRSEESRIPSQAGGE